jgi:hypothetical protein
MRTMPKAPTLNKHLPLLLGAFALVAGANVALSSGTYTARPPQPRAEEKSRDRAKYSLGQRVFDGKVKAETAVQPDAEAQRARLSELQTRLPERVGKKKELSTLAGKLTPEQLDALDYYVKERYAK